MARGHEDSPPRDWRDCGRQACIHWLHWDDPPTRGSRARAPRRQAPDVRSSWSRRTIALARDGVRRCEVVASPEHGEGTKGKPIITSSPVAGDHDLPLVEVLQSAPDAVIGIDASGAIVFANRQVETLFGYAPDELVGQSVETLLPERIRDAHRQHRARYFAEPVTRPMGASLQLAGLRRSGTEFPIDISLAAVESRDGIVAYAFVRDLTDRKQTEAMFRGLLDAAPDATVVIDEHGVITLVNRQVHELFGYTPEELIGQSVELLVPERFRGVHPEHRTAYLADPRNRAMGAGLDLTARRKDGSEFPVDIALAPFDTDQRRLVSAAVRDITERVQAERNTQRLREGEIRRRQALEINDSVVQGVATAVYALGRDDVTYALQALGATLESARLMMDQLLDHAGDAAVPTPASLVRERPATVLTDSSARPTTPAGGRPAEDTITVVLADDTDDMRYVLGLALEEDGGFTVVGEAADGQAAVDQAAKHHPDVVLLDLAMPVMDGLQAAPLIRRVSPDSRLVVLSGYGAEDMLDAAMRAGADAYVTKGRPAESLCTLLRDLCPGKGGAGRGSPRAVGPQDPGEHFGQDRQAAQDLALAVTAHELATPITVLRGMLKTLRGRMDTLPPSMVLELLDAMDRHVDHMSRLLAVLNDARNVSRDTLVLARDSVDVCALVEQTIADLAPALTGRSVRIQASSPVRVFADAVRLRQVISNLLTNAAKFSPASSPIEVEVTPLRGTVQVAVTDHGAGVPVERRPQLFTKFGRLGSDTSGMGLGLFISRGIVRAHGGELRLARSGPNGTTFAFELPVMTVAEAPAR